MYKDVLEKCLASDSKMVFVAISEHLGKNLTLFKTAYTTIVNLGICDNQLVMGHLLELLNNPKSEDLVYSLLTIEDICASVKSAKKTEENKKFKKVIEVYHKQYLNGFSGEFQVKLREYLLQI